jgi:hypothetical protein
VLIFIKNFINFINLLAKHCVNIHKKMYNIVKLLLMALTLFFLLGSPLII